MKHPRDVLDYVLSKHTIESSMISMLCGVRENTWHDLKSAKVFATANSKKAALELAQDTTAFANADGGMLLFGIEDDRTSRSPVPEHAEAWVNSILLPLVQQGAPRPRIVHRDGVMVVAVPRSPQLVPLARDGKFVYFIRVGDGTARVPEYLASDLLVGRRSHPKFAISDAYASWLVSSEVSNPAFNLFITVANESPVWVGDLRAYLVGIMDDCPEASSFLQQGIERLPECRVAGCKMAIKQSSDDPAFEARHVYQLPPSATVQVSARVIPPVRSAEKAIWQGALAIVPKDGRIQWFQVDTTVDQATARDSKGLFRPHPNARLHASVRGVWPELPIVHW